MKKEVLTEQNKHQLIQRILALRADARSKWGNMSVNEMMFHCAKVNSEILKGKPSNSKPTWKQWLIKTIVLRSIKNLPKGIKTSTKFLKTKEDNLDFTAERERLIESVHQFAGCKEAIYGVHPFFGPLQTLEWRRFVQMHIDHHLRQFGV